MSKTVCAALLVVIGTPVVAGAGCSATDQAYVHAHKGSDSASFGQSASDCGYKAYSIFDGFNKDIFKTCMEKKTQLSDSCAGCYAGAGQYGADNCKWDCMDSWCSSDCLTCTAKYLGSLQQCTGFKADAVSPCSMSLNATVVV